MELRRVPSRNRMRKVAEKRTTFRAVGLSKSTRENFLRAGKRQILMHQNGYPLAANKMMQEIDYNDLCMKLLRLKGSTYTDILFYKATEEGNKTNFTSKLININSFKQGMVSVSEGKLSILALPKKGKGKLTKRTNTQLFKAANIGSSRRKASNASGDELSASKHFRKMSENATKTARNKKTGKVQKNSSLHVGSQLDDDFGTIASFALNHIYNIEIQSSKTKDFSVSFYCRVGEGEQPQGTSPSQNFQIVTLSFKADTPEKAEKFVTNLLIEAEAMNKLIEAYIGQLVKEQTKIQQSLLLSDTSTLGDLIRLSIDLWGVVKGNGSMEVLNAIDKLIQYLQNVGDIEEEASFWQSQKRRVQRKMEALESISFDSDVGAEETSDNKLNNQEKNKDASDESLESLGGSELDSEFGGKLEATFLDVIRRKIKKENAL